MRAGTHAFRLTHPRSAESLIDEAAFAVDERLPYWADIWPSSRVLADILVRHQGDGRRVLELGSGSGLVACALAVAGYSIVASDYYPASLVTTAQNVLTNTGRTIETRLIDWRDLPADLERFDVVVAADVLYERSYAPLVAGVIARTMAPDGFAMVADPGRVAFEPFLLELSQRGIIVDEGWEVPHELDQQRHTIRIRVLRWGPTPPL